MIVFFLLFIFLFSFKAYAVCPVCTIAVGAGLEISRMLGIDDTITGIWAGGLTLSFIIWTKSYLEKKNITSLLSKILNFVIFYALTFSIYLLPDVIFGVNTLWGIDKLLLGIIVGSFGLYVGNISYEKLKAHNNNHAYFPYQKVVMPIFMLIILSIIFCFICA